MILAIDQGTTGTTVIIVDPNGHIIGRSHKELRQIYPQAGWVEHDPEEIWQITYHTIQEVLTSANLAAKELSAIGITNQRETTVVWDKETGKPVHNAIVWQCRRSSELCQKIKTQGKQDWIQGKTGLLVDAYFSATKLQWLFNHKPQLRALANDNRLCFGTIDSWLIWKLTGGKHHLTDHTNASRTLLYNLQSQSWDEELLNYFDLPKAILPEIKPSSGIFAHTAPEAFLGIDIPIAGVAGDQQAALFGQRCIEPGAVKNTYGTGCFMLMYTGSKRSHSQHGLLSTIACDKQGQPAYALEGSVFSAGAGVQWLRDELSIIASAGETDAIATSVDSTLGVYIVPAFTGLGAPYWDMDARAAIIGLSRGSGKAEIVRATLEAIAYQSKDLVDLMRKESQNEIKSMRVDGGASANNFLMQFQADLLNAEIQRPIQIESTAIGAAMLAGIGAGIWSANSLPEPLSQIEKTFKATMSSLKRDKLYTGWQQAVARVRS